MALQELPFGVDEAVQLGVQRLPLHVQCQQHQEGGREELPHLPGPTQALPGHAKAHLAHETSTDTRGVPDDAAKLLRRGQAFCLRLRI
jgi:hypothetical protein